MNDSMHDLLTEEGQNWRDGLGPDPDLAALLTAPRRHARALPAMLAAAAVIVAVAVAVSVIAAHGTRRPSAVAAHGTTCQDEFIAAPTQFTPTGHGQDQEVALRLTYTGARACVIDGHGPHADLLDAAGKSLGQAIDTSSVGTPPLTVKPGDVVALTMNLGGICPQVDRPVTALRLHMDGNLNTGTNGVEVPAPGASLTSCPSMSQPPGVIAGFRFPKIVKSGQLVHTDPLLPSTTNRPGVSSYPIDPSVLVGGSWRIIEVDVSSRVLPLPPKITNFVAFSRAGHFLGNDSVNDANGRYRLTTNGFVLRNVEWSVVALIGAGPAQSALEEAMGQMSMSNAAVIVRRVSSTVVVLQVGKYTMWCKRTGNF